MNDHAEQENLNCYVISFFIIISPMTISDKHGKLRVGLIGAGDMGSRNHAPGWKQLDYIDLVGVADVSPDRARKLATEHGIPKAFDNIEELLSMDLDILDICTPNTFHIPQAEKALQAGVHVLCEKPLGLTVAEIKKVGHLADEKGLLLMAAQMKRFTRRSRIAHDWAMGGGLGTPYHAHIRDLRTNQLPGAPTFTTKRIAGGGPCIDVGPHMLDLCLWFMDFPRPVRISGTTSTNFALGEEIKGIWGEWDRETFDVEDFASGMVTFDTGATLLIQIAWLGMHEPHDTNNMWVYGTKGSLSDQGARYAFADNGKVINRTFAQDEDGKNPYFEEIRYLAEAVRDGKQSPIPWQQSLFVTAILDGIYQSHQAGREITFDLTDEHAQLKAIKATSAE